MLDQNPSTIAGLDRDICSMLPRVPSCLDMLCLRTTASIVHHTCYIANHMQQHHEQMAAHAKTCFCIWHVFFQPNSVIRRMKKSTESLLSWCAARGIRLCCHDNSFCHSTTAAVDAASQAKVGGSTQFKLIVLVLSATFPATAQTGVAGLLYT